MRYRTERDSGKAGSEREEEKDSGSAGAVGDRRGMERDGKNGEGHVIVAINSLEMH